MSGKLRVVVLFGGRSGEHEVSLQSAASVIKALDKEKYEVLPVGITKEGSWLVGAGPEEVREHGFGADLLPVTLSCDPQDPRFVPLRAPGPYAGELGKPIDVVFPVLHGTYGEDGSVQGLLELAGLPYVGGGVASSAAGMDKVLMKKLFAYHGLPQARFVSVLRRDWEQRPQRVLALVEEEIGYPCFVKPANLGSSVGISKAKDREGLVQALQEAAQYDRKLVVEEFIDGREIEVSVLGNDDPQVSVPGEIIPCNEFYDYEAKYLAADSKLIIPADLPEPVVAEIRRLAVEAFQAIDCAGMARVDFFVGRKDQRVFINEINTIPGFTRISMYPKLWEAAGLPYPRLLDRLIELALERHRDRSRNRYAYMT
ncbi:MAG TPA: D-alanine--D-alanine ligase [Clostridia bacterium]|nr:D-alanine--D-alanine ligase [Clostridia bacterium]